MKGPTQCKAIPAAACKPSCVLAPLTLRGAVEQAAAYYPQKATEEAAAAVLAMAFPSYSAAALRKVRAAAWGF